MVAMVAMMFNANAQVKVESPNSNLNVKIINCTMSNETAVINMVLSNYGPDEELSISNGDIEIYDNKGNYYDSKNTKITLGLTSAKKLSSSSSFTLPKDSPLKFSVSIKGVSEKTSKLTLMKLGFKSKGKLKLKKSDPVQIRNIEFSKK